MCGIINNKLLEKELIEKINNLIAHRGPNDKGIYLEKTLHLGIEDYQY